MLKIFKVRGFKNFQETLIIDLRAANYEFNSECTHNNLVKTALIYGKNSTGKTNLGWAIFDLIEHLTDHRTLGLQKKHYLNANSKDEYAEFEYNFFINNKDIVYCYSKNELHEIISEKLTIDDKVFIDYPVGKNFTTSFKGTEHLNKTINSDSNLSALKYIHNNANLDLRNPFSKTFNMLMHFINTMLLFRSLLDEVTFVGFKRGVGNIYDSILRQNNLKDFQTFLSECGINYKLVKVESDGSQTIGVKFKNKVIPLSSIASTGTKSLALFYHWWQYAKNDMASLIFIDEFDASYHFDLSRMIVKRLKQINSQVILTTHNTNLLDNDLIRPDCGFVIDKKGVLSLHSRTNKDLRQAHNIEKMYRAGSFDE